MGECKTKILFVIPELVGGGAERILIEILKNLDRQRFMLSLALFSGGGRFFGEVPGDVPVKVLEETRHYGLLGLIRIVLKLVRLIRKEKTDVVFSVM